MKQIIRLRESELRRMIAESIKRVLNEDDGLVHFNGMNFDQKTWDKYGDYIQKCMREGWSNEEIAHLLQSNAQKRSELPWIEDEDF